MPSNPSRFTRRQALGLAAAALAGLALPAGAKQAAGTGEGEAWAARIAPALDAFCDTLLPADPPAPAATALAVPAQVLAIAQGNANLRRLFDFSLQWLDQAAGGRFVDADPPARHGLLETMAALPWDAPPRRFFHLMRDLAMGFYYAHPEALGDARLPPPQPGGYFESLP
jgi:hypothetical protein